MATTRGDDPAATRANRRDAPLRRDVRLVGDALGRVLVEQDGEELLADVERVRNWRARRANPARRPITRRSRTTSARSTASARPPSYARSGCTSSSRTWPRRGIACAAAAATNGRSRSRASRWQRRSGDLPAAASGRASWRAARLRSRSSSSSPRTRPRPPAARCCRLSSRSAGSSRRSTTPHSRRPRAAVSRTRSRPRSPPCGRPTKCARDARASSTRSVTRCGSSRRRCSMWLPTCSRLRAFGL